MLGLVLVACLGLLAAPGDGGARPTLARLVADVHVRGDCDPTGVRREIRRKLSVLQRCVRGHAGEARVELTCAASGKVRAVDAEGTWPPSVLRCVEKRLRGVKMPTGGRGGEPCGVRVDLRAATRT